MALSYKARKRWSLVILVIGLPLYAGLAVNLVAILPALPKALEFIMYVGHFIIPHAVLATQNINTARLHLLFLSQIP
jgi:hypothetical protein